MVFAAVPRRIGTVTSSPAHARILDLFKTQGSRPVWRVKPVAENKNQPNPDFF
jgi:hypothetical protein